MQSDVITVCTSVSPTYNSDVHGMKCNKRRCIQLVGHIENALNFLLTNIEEFLVSVCVCECMAGHVCNSVFIIIWSMSIKAIGVRDMMPATQPI